MNLGMRVLAEDSVPYTAATHSGMQQGSSLHQHGGSRQMRRDLPSEHTFVNDMTAPSVVPSMSAKLPLQSPTRSNDQVLDAGRPCSNTKREMWRWGRVMVSIIVVSTVGLWAVGMLAGGYGYDAEQRQQLDPNGRLALSYTKGAIPNTKGKGLEKGTIPPGIGVRVSNDYTTHTAIQLYPWEHMTEPYRPTKFKVKSWPDMPDEVQFR